jgi:hypothetical protein
LIECSSYYSLYNSDSLLFSARNTMDVFVSYLLSARGGILSTMSRCRTRRSGRIGERLLGLTLESSASRQSSFHDVQFSFRYNLCLIIPLVVGFAVELLHSLALAPTWVASVCWIGGIGARQTDRATFLHCEKHVNIFNVRTFSMTSWPIPHMAMAFELPSLHLSKDIVNHKRSLTQEVQASARYLRN